MLMFHKETERQISKLTNSRNYLDPNSLIATDSRRSTLRESHELSVLQRSFLVNV